MLHVVVSLFDLTIFSFCTCFQLLYLFPPSISLITTPPNEPSMGVANPPTGKNPPFCLRLFCLPPIYHTSFCILKSHRFLVQCYVLWCKVSPCHDNTYKHSQSEYAHIVNLSFLGAVFFS